jgi:GNAT superfamily N-acetyltransferase
MLVKLYDLPQAPTLEKLAAEGISIRRAMAPDKLEILAWVQRHFGEGWASECDVAFSMKPIACHIAVKDGQVLGFACYESTCRGFFGPTGVDEAWRGRGIGAQLLFACLNGLRDMGYAYAVIGGAGPVDFYARTVGAVPIEGSVPGIYRDRIRRG